MTDNYDSKIKPFSERYKMAMELRNMKAVELSRRTGISEPALSQYASGKAEPKKDRAVRIAEVLEVNHSWLIGLNKPMETVDSIKNSGLSETKQYREVLLMLDRLNEDGLSKVSGYVSDLLEISKYLADKPS